MGELVKLKDPSIIGYHHFECGCYLGAVHILASAKKGLPTSLINFHGVFSSYCDNLLLLKSHRDIVAFTNRSNVRNGIPRLLGSNDGGQYFCLFLLKYIVQ